MARLLTPVTLEGQWVRLEPLAPDHVHALLLAATQSRETYAFTDVPDTLTAMTASVANALRDQHADRTLPFATVDNKTGTVVGSTRFGNVEFWDGLQEAPINGVRIYRTPLRSAGPG